MSLFELQYTSLCLESSGVQKRGTKVEGLSMRSGRIKAGLEVEKRGKSELTLTFYFFFCGYAAFVLRGQSEREDKFAG